MNGTFVKSTLELFKLHNINSEKVLEQIAELLKNKNRYIAKQAFDYLNGVDNLNKKTSKKMIDIIKRAIKFKVIVKFICICSYFYSKLFNNY